MSSRSKWRTLAAAIVLQVITVRGGHSQFVVSALNQTADVRRGPAIGRMRDGLQIDHTTRAATQHASSDLAVASFGTEPGRVYAGETGTATVTATSYATLLWATLARASAPASCQQPGRWTEQAVDEVLALLPSIDSRKPTLKLRYLEIPDAQIALRTQAQNALIPRSRRVAWVVSSPQTGRGGSGSESVLFFYWQEIHEMNMPRLLAGAAREQTTDRGWFVLSDEDDFYRVRLRVFGFDGDRLVLDAPAPDSRKTGRSTAGDLAATPVATLVLFLPNGTPTDCMHVDFADGRLAVQFERREPRIGRVTYALSFDPLSDAWQAVLPFPGSLVETRELLNSEETLMRFPSEAPSPSRSPSAQ